MWRRRRRNYHRVNRPREKACADNWETISYAEMRRMKEDRSIDGIYDWSGGYWVSYDKIMDIC